jgi:GT2 family glycosyltransferase
MSRGPRFSILTAVWNTDPRYLRGCVNSVLDQAYRNWEWCIVDDGSTRPETRALLQRISGIDPRIRVAFSHEHGGISAAQNRALEMARGEFISLVDHDDLLEPGALRMVAAVTLEHPDADVIYTDEDYIDTSDNQLTVIFKPAWSPEYLMAACYFNHLTSYRRELVNELGGFRPDYELAQDWDLALRVTQVTDRVHHVPAVLYHWRRNPTSAGHNWDNACYWRKRCHADHVRERYGPDAVSQPIWMDGFFWTHRPLRARPLVSVIIPTMGARQRLRGVGTTMVVNCLRSLFSRTRYQELEVICVVDPLTSRSARAELAEFADKPNVRFVQATESFNFSSRINLGAQHARGEHLLLLNDDIEVIRPDWIDAMLELSQEPDVGVVGGKLRFPNGAIESCGINLLPGQLVDTPFRGYPATHPGHVGSLVVNREWSAVTGACQMVRADVFREVGGYDEGFVVDFGDVDFCLRVRERGYRVVSCPRAELTHYEAASRATGGSGDVDKYRERWSKAEEPYWNPMAMFTQDYWLSCPTPSGVAVPYMPEPATIA